MKCAEDVKPKGTVKGGEEEDISEEEGDDIGDQSNGNGLTHNSTMWEIRNFLFQEPTAGRQQRKTNNWLCWLTPY